ncbi:MAG TPA: sulfatase-like hydrolase/transferase [Kiritimatiellia bacterium]|nr:sulfatase-like hydrolase/transferase [Kiritimatiellia bacterium]
MAKKQQLILVMTDTQRVDMVGAYGLPAMKTPALDRLASEGVRCERAYTCQPVCGPARAALFTGTWPHINNGWSNGMALDARSRSVGQRVRDAGIHAAYVGKWHLDGGDYFGEGVCPDGWDPKYWYDMKCYLDQLTPEQRVASRQEKTMYEGEGIPADFTFGHRVASRAVDFLSRHGEEPFLLVVSFDEPHGPFLAPKKFIDQHADTKLPWRENMADPLADKPEHQRAWAGKALHREPAPGDAAYQSYFACNSFVDSEIGRVLDAIDRHAPDALVIYTADHGDMLGSHRLTNKGPVMYDEITRIPFLVRWPGVIPPGSVSANLVSHIDIVPTILDAFEIPQPATLHGRSMLPMWRNPATVTNAEVFIEFGRYEIDHDGFGGFQPVRCVRDARYKLVINLLCTDELYDMEQDPGELTNLIESPAHAAARDRLHDRLITWMNETRDPFRGYYWVRRPWRSDAPPPTWDFTGFTRQREPEPGETRQLDYDTGLPYAQATRRKIVPDYA